jgi:hypothetical protein
VGGSKRLSSLLLHRDETAGEAIVPLNVAIRLAPGDASLFDRRALAHALSGSEAAAERDWGAGRRVRTPLDGTDDQPGLACKQRFNCPVWYPEDPFGEVSPDVDPVTLAGTATDVTPGPYRHDEMNAALTSGPCL